MVRESVTNLFASTISELGGVFNRINDKDVDRACGMISEAKKIVVFGGGRERLQIMGFAMRLFHLGLVVAVEGDMTTPPVGHGDLFIVTCGPGEISTALALMGVAKAAGSKILFITAQIQSRGAALADYVLQLPAQTMADDQVEKRSSVLPMGSLFEGALFVLFEVMILKLIVSLKVTAEAMRANHTNLE